jgi:guanine nucleotide-binding protein subunit alpha
MAMRAGNDWKMLVRNDDGTKLGFGAENDPTTVLIAQRDDIIALWENPINQSILDKRRPGLADSPGLLSQLLFTRRLN